MIELITFGCKRIKMPLDQEFWGNKYKLSATGWDLGTVSPPIKAFFDGVSDKDLEILIPGCGNAYEAEYLHQQGFKNVHVLDLVEEPLNNLRLRIPDFPENHIHQGDFFSHTGCYDLIIEQTLFCAIDPSFRQAYAKKIHQLLKPGGMLVGVLFNCSFESGPPFGGSKEEYQQYFEPLFNRVSMLPCYNSIGPRVGNELFIRIGK